MMNIGVTVLRKRFRVFVHHPQEVAATLTSQGFTRIFQDTSGVWDIVVYQRQR